MTRLAILAAVLMLAGCTGMAHRTSLHLTFDDGSCSGTAIGPHALLGAEHCFAGSKLKRVDGKPVTVRKIIRDHADHVIVLVSERFAHWSLRARMPGRGSPVYIDGNPGNLRDIYRHGYVAGRA
jgi:hypothetical protein